jgi:hypothetical protein
MSPAMKQYRRWRNQTNEDGREAYGMSVSVGLLNKSMIGGRSLVRYSWSSFASPQKPMTARPPSAKADVKPHLLSAYRLLSRKIYKHGMETS